MRDGERSGARAYNKQCRDCGIDFFPRGVESTRYCKTCAVANKRLREEKKRRARKRTVKRPQIKNWATKRRSGLALNCIACGVEFERPGSVAVDHIIPAAVVAEFNKNFTKLGIFGAENEKNLVSVCRGCHGKKRRAEIRLERGDVLTFMAELRRIGYPEERTKTALRLYGLLR